MTRRASSFVLLFLALSLVLNIHLVRLLNYEISDSIRILKESTLYIEELGAARRQTDRSIEVSEGCISTLQQQNIELSQFKKEVDEHSRLLREQGARASHAESDLRGCLLARNEDAHAFQEHDRLLRLQADEFFVEYSEIHAFLLDEMVDWTDVMRGAVDNGCDYDPLLDLVLELPPPEFPGDEI